MEDAPTGREHQGNDETRDEESILDINGDLENNRAKKSGTVEEVEVENKRVYPCPLMDAIGIYGREKGRIAVNKLKRAKLQNLNAVKKKLLVRIVGTILKRT